MSPVGLGKHVGAQQDELVELATVPAGRLVGLNWLVPSTDFELFGVDVLATDSKLWNQSSWCCVSDLCGAYGLAYSKSSAVGTLSYDDCFRRSCHPID